MLLTLIVAVYTVVPLELQVGVFVISSVIFALITLECEALLMQDITALADLYPSQLHTIFSISYLCSETSVIFACVCLQFRHWRCSSPCTEQVAGAETDQSLHSCSHSPQDEKTHIIEASSIINAA